MLRKVLKVKIKKKKEFISINNSQFWDDFLEMYESF